MVLAALLLVPGLATLWTAWREVRRTRPRPARCPLTLAGLGALAVNVTCALILVRYRAHSGSLSKAAFLSARNDAFANVAIIAAGLVTAFLWRTPWPDLAVGIAIALVNLDAARGGMGSGARGARGRGVRCAGRWSFRAPRALP